MAHLKVLGKGSKTRYVRLHPAASGLIVDYLEADGRGLEATGALFRAVGNRAGGLGKAITADAIYKIVRGYSAKLGFEIGAHSLRATAAKKRARPPSRYRQGAGVAGAREHCDDADLRPPENEG